MLPWTAHLYTALGAAAALLSALAIFDDDFRVAFLWLAVQVVIDATDGVLARAVRVKERLPWFDGALLDNIIDYVTYVFLPVLIALRAHLVPDGWGAWIGSAILIASGYGFSRTDAKIEQRGQHFFTGFPSYWNIVVLYLYVCGLRPVLNAGILLTLAVLVFVPLRYVYPSRTLALRRLTVVLGLSWGLLLLWMMWRLPDTGGPWLMLSLVFPAYYVVLSLWLDYRSRS